MKSLAFDYEPSNGWGAKTITRDGVTHIELRRMFHEGQMLIVVGLDGWNLKPGDVVDPVKEWHKQNDREARRRAKSAKEVDARNPGDIGSSEYWARYPLPTAPPAWVHNNSTKGFQVRVSLNSPASMTINDFHLIQQEVDKAFNWLMINTAALSDA